MEKSKIHSDHHMKKKSNKLKARLKPGASEKAKLLAGSGEKENGKFVSPDLNWQVFLSKQKNNVEEKAKFKRRSVKTTRAEHKKNIISTKQEDTTNETINDDIWFDKVDKKLLVQAKEAKINSSETSITPISKSSYELDEKTEGNSGDVLSTTPTITKHVGLDCEMVGVGREGKESILARVSLVNARGECIYDKFVRPSEHVVDYRTAVSGVRASNLRNATDYKTVQKEVAELLRGKILVGHALTNDFKTLMLSHSRRQVRDTATYKPFRKRMKTKRPALKKLATEVLGVTIQTGEHSSVEDARTAMQLYQAHKKEWEKSLRGDPSGTMAKKNITIHIGTDSMQTKKNNKWTKIKKRIKAKANKIDVADDD